MGVEGGAAGMDVDGVAVGCGGGVASVTGFAGLTGRCCPGLADVGLLVVLSLLLIGSAFGAAGLWLAAAGKTWLFTEVSGPGRSITPVMDERWLRATLS